MTAPQWIQEPTSILKIFKTSLKDAGLYEKYKSLLINLNFKELIPTYFPPGVKILLLKHLRLHSPTFL